MDNPASIIASILNCDAWDIKNIEVLKRGMTNRSYLFTYHKKKYIMRIPGEGTRELINRREEAEVYRTINNMGICDDIIYIDPSSGYKITSYFEDARCCDPYDVRDVTRCMRKLRSFHEKEYQVGHEFDLYEKIEYYESLWMSRKSIYANYNDTKAEVFSLRGYVEQYRAGKVLCHIDSVADNFLIMGDEIRLIDWEYAGMQDPHVDIAMFCVYVQYSREQIDQVISAYFDGDCTQEIRVKIYCYIGICGLLWSNWCEYKRDMGTEFGEYAAYQYHYAEEFYSIAREEIGRLEKEHSCIK